VSAFSEAQLWLLAIMLSIVWFYVGWKVRSILRHFEYDAPPVTVQRGNIARTPVPDPTLVERCEECSHIRADHIDLGEGECLGHGMPCPCVKFRQRATLSSEGA